MQIPKDIVRLQYEYQNLLSKFQGLEQLFLKQSNELIQLKKTNENLKCNVENYECIKCKKQQNQIDQMREEKKKDKQLIEEYEKTVIQKKEQFEEFREQVQQEMDIRIQKFEIINKETVERLDRVQKDNTLFEILLREREIRIEQLNQIIYEQEKYIQQEQNEDNAWKQKFMKINKDYHKLLSEYNSIKADLDAMYVTQKK